MLCNYIANDEFFFKISSNNLAIKFLFIFFRHTAQIFLRYIYIIVVTYYSISFFDAIRRKKMMIIKQNVVEKKLNEKSFSIQILRFVVTIKSRVIKIIETLIQLKFSVNKFQTEKFEINIDINATKSQNENDFVSKNDFEKNISNEMQKITNEKLKTKVKL